MEFSTFLCHRTETTLLKLEKDNHTVIIFTSSLRRSYNDKKFIMYGLFDT